MTDLAWKLAELRRRRGGDSDDRLAPMHGLWCGLALVAPFWAGIGLVAWQFCA